MTGGPAGPVDGHQARDPGGRLTGPPDGRLTDPPDGPGGPPGSSVFSLDNRPGPGLYLAAWVLSCLAIAVLFVASLADPGGRALLLLAGLVLLGLGLAAAAGYQILARRGRPPSAYRGPAPLIVFGIWFALVNLAALLLLAFGIEGLDDPGSFLAGVAAQAAVYFLVIWIFVVRSGALSPADLGLPRGADLSRLLGDAAFTVGIMVPVTFIALVGGGLLAQLLDATPPTVVPAPDTGPELLAVLVAAAILVPIGEELFFRGFALSAWLRDLGPRSALIRSSVFFAVIHIVNIQSETFGDGLRQALVLLAVFLPLGFVLGWLYLRRGLLGATLGHITYNTILVVLLVLVTQFS